MEMVDQIMDVVSAKTLLLLTEPCRVSISIHPQKGNIKYWRPSFTCNPMKKKYHNIYLYDNFEVQIYQTAHDI